MARLNNFQEACLFEIFLYLYHFYSAAMSSLRHLHECATIRSPLGSLSLLIHHIGLRSSFAMTGVSRYTRYTHFWAKYCYVFF